MGKKNKDIKLIFFDMDGVIVETGVVEKGKRTAASTWTAIAEKLGPKAEEEEQKTKDKWNEGQYNNYLEWMENTIKIHKKYGLDEKTFNSIVKNPERYMKGAIGVLKELKKRGYKIAIITGSFKNIANQIQKEAGVDHVFASCEYFFEEGQLVSWNLLPGDYEAKVDFMKLLIREHSLIPENCAFIGDGVNDIPLAKRAGFSIAFNGRKELGDVCDVSINQEEKDLRAILKYFN